MSNAYNSKLTGIEIEELLNMTNNIITQTEANNLYLTLLNGFNTYLTINDAQGLYLTNDDANAIYLTLLDAADNYLTQNNAADIYVLPTTIASIYLNQNDATTSYTTKTLINNLAIINNSSYTALTSSSNTATSSWQTFLSNWTAPNNGYLNTYFNGSSNTPSMNVADVSNGFCFRCNGNGSRDINVILPVIKGRTYIVEGIYCKPNWIRFFPALTI